VSCREVDLFRDGSFMIYQAGSKWYEILPPEYEPIRLRKFRAKIV